MCGLNNKTGNTANLTRLYCACMCVLFVCSLNPARFSYINSRKLQYMELETGVQCSLLHNFLQKQTLESIIGCPGN